MNTVTRCPPGYATGYIPAEARGGTLDQLQQLLSYMRTGGGMRTSETPKAFVKKTNFYHRGN